MWGTHARQGDDREDLTLTPAGKFTDAMASRIWKAVVNAALEEPETRALIEQQFAAGGNYGFKTKIIEHVLGKNKKQKRQIIEQIVPKPTGSRPRSAQWTRSTTLPSD